MYFQYFKFKKRHNSYKNWRKLMTLELDRMFIRRKWHAKFQLNMSKHVGEILSAENCDWRTETRTDGQMDRRTDRHHHTIIRPVWRRAYKKRNIGSISHGFVNHGCPRRQQSQKQNMLSSIFWSRLTLGAFKISEVWGTYRWTYDPSMVLYHHPSFKYCTLFKAGRNYGQTDRRTDNPNY